jgi:hypothetical protein
VEWCHFETLLSEANGQTQCQHKGKQEASGVTVVLQWCHSGVTVVSP